MVDLDEFALSKLARELAMNIRSYKSVFEDFGITEEDYYEIEKIEFYKRAKDQYTLEWNSALSAADRVKLISAAYVEASLPTIGRRMLNEAEPLSNVIDAGKFLAKNAGIGESKAGPGSSDRFIIQINLGDDANGKEIVEIYDKSIAVEANDSADVNRTSVTNPLPSSPNLPVDAPNSPDPRQVAFAAFTMEEDDGPSDSQAEAEPTQVRICPPRKRGRPKGSRNRQLSNPRQIPR